MIELDKFIGFSFCGIHSSKYNVMAISNGSTYSMPLFADFMDKTETVDGYDGEYYFGTNFIGKPRIISCFVEGADENTLRNIQSWFHPKRIGKLTFDESPYKYYIAKVSRKPDFNYTPMGNNLGHYYTGTVEVEFKAFDPFAYSYVNSVDDYTYYEESQALWYYDSGILYHEETPPVVVNNITDTTNILLYNGGNAETKPIITVIGSANEITIANLTTNQQFTLSGLVDVEMVVDCQKGHVRVQDVPASSFHEGGYIELKGSNRVDRYLDVDFTNGSNEIIISDNLDLDIIGRFIAINDDWYKVTDRNFDTGLITLDKDFEGETAAYSISVIDLNEINISGINMNIESIEFDYKFCYL